MQMVPKIQPWDSWDLSNSNEVNTQVTMSTTEPRLTRFFNFEWKLGCNTIRISKVEGQAHTVSWVESHKQDGPFKIHGPEVGPSLNQKFSGCGCDGLGSGTGGFGGGAPSYGSCFGGQELEAFIP